MKIIINHYTKDEKKEVEINTYSEIKEVLLENNLHQYNVVMNNFYNYTTANIQMFVLGFLEYLKNKERKKINITASSESFESYFEYEIKEVFIKAGYKNIVINNDIVFGMKTIKEVFIFDNYLKIIFQDKTYITID